MKLYINGTAYPCKGRPSFTDPVRFTLPGDKPDAAALGNTLTLKDDDGNVLREVDISAITLRRYFEGDTLVCTNTPEPEPVTPTEQISEEDTTLDMMADHEYRLCMMELGAV